MGLRRTFLARFARQLGHPRGPAGRLVAALLNRHNRTQVAGAVAASGIGPGDTALDVGFGGGVGLRLLLDRVGPAGVVHGVELSDTMLARAARRYRTARLHPGAMERIPLPDSTVDAAITVNTVYFVPDLTVAFAELARVLRPTGTLVVGLGDPDTMAGIPVTATGFLLRPVAEVAGALATAGLRVVDHQRIGDGPFHLLVAGPRDDHGAD
ncbi:class I SAM-dependent methyltransferase [Longispora sp. K20-0274]|uniref:class I SAM-dependent methyltransferase n=1 Tax=Longispora sp. K20-0274 TaxID=3088255 RepID=UPI0039997F75